jgi:hypothetical protein
MPAPPFPPPDHRPGADVAMWSDAAGAMSQPFLRPSVARARLAALGVDAATPAGLFAALEARRWMFTATGPRSFGATIRAVDPADPRGEQRELAHAGGLSFGHALAVALCVAIEAYPDWVPRPWTRPTPEPDGTGSVAMAARRRRDDDPAH